MSISYCRGLGRSRIDDYDLSAPAPNRLKPLIRIRGTHYAAVADNRVPPQHYEEISLLNIGDGDQGLVPAEQHRCELSWIRVDRVLRVGDVRSQVPDKWQ